MKKIIYLSHQYNFIDKFILKKRLEMLDIINKFIEKSKINDALDIGTTEDEENLSSNSIIKNIKNVKKFKSISNQKIISKFFCNILQKSITEDFNESEIEDMSSDIVLSTATIEHVGDEKSQIKMIENIIKLTKKVFVITTPNRFHPLEFHTKIPFIHWLPKPIHRALLKILGENFLSKEENLNLLSRGDLDKIFKVFEKKIKYNYFSIKLLGITSNHIIIGLKKS